MRTYVERIAAKRGIPLRNASKPVAVLVTQTDVVKAKQSNSKSCALSMAARRVPGVLAGFFFRSTAFLQYADKILRFHLPPSVQKEIVAFDRSGSFDPGVYQLSPPCPSVSNPKPAKAQSQRKPLRATTGRRLETKANIDKIFNAEAGDLPKLDKFAADIDRVLKRGAATAGVPVERKTISGKVTAARRTRFIRTHEEVP